MRFLLLLLAVSLPCSVPRLRAGEPPAAGRGSFHARLWVATSREFFRGWKAGRRELPAPPELTRGAAGNDPVFAAVSFAGPAVDASGLAHVRYHLRVLRPDGSVYAHQPEALGLRGWAGLSPWFPQLGRDSVAIVPERRDPPGFYLVEANVRDVVTGEELPTLRASFLVR